MSTLEELPPRMDRLELQIVQLQTETRDELSALRDEIRAGDEETRRVIREEIHGLGIQMRVLHEEVMSRFALFEESRVPPRPRTHKRRGK